VDNLNMDLTKVDDAANEMGTKVAGQVLESFASAPMAAQAAAGMNATYLTSAAMVAMFAEIAMAIKQLNEHTSEHAELLRSTAQLMRDRDTRMATETFSTSTIFPNGG
jgi:gamma-glutamyl phosphate reductase